MSELKIYLFTLGVEKDDQLFVSYSMYLISLVG